MTDTPRFAAAFAAHVEQQPQATALLWHDREISYAELAEMAADRRHLLADLAPGEPVGILATKSPAAIALILACLLTGRRFLLPSPTLAPETLAALFGTAGCRTVLRDDDIAAGAAPGAAPAGFLPRVSADAVAFMLTTSGSTGTPKIVPIPHRALDAFTAWAGPAFDIRPGRSVLNYAPLNFDLCLLDIWTTLAHGGRVVLVDTALAAQGRHLLTLLLRHRVDVVQAVPMFYGLVQEAARATGAPMDLTPLRHVSHLAFTGDVIGTQILAALPALFPGARLFNIYGCTETNDSFMAEIAPAETSSRVPIGQALPGVRSIVVDEQGVVLDGPGTGELYVCTPFQSPGYLDPARSVGRFVAHPCGGDDRTWFRTGDLVSRDAGGRLDLIGRTDFQVKVRGVAINTAEVEAVLLQHPDVIEVAVLTWADPLLGRQLSATVRRNPGSNLNSFGIRQHCARRLPRAAIPATVRVTDEPLPRTSTGKVDRNAADRMPEPASTTGRTS